MKKILILTDGKAGHENQSRAFVRSLGFEGEVVEIHFKSKFHKTLSYLFDHLHLYSPSLFGGLVETALPAAVVGTGSGTFYAAKTFARRLGVKCGVVLYPRGYNLKTFDCILAPSFDQPAQANNIIEIPANLVAADEDFYNKGIEAFKTRYTGATDNLIGVIIGGPNKCSTMNRDWLKGELDRIFHEERGQFCVTTSRRTPAEIEALVDSYPWDYKLLYSRDHFNPIPAFVKLAKKLYVTAESTGMLSEACTFGTAEVIALDNLKSGDHKFRRFVDGLIHLGYLNGNRKVNLSASIERAKQLLGL